MKTHLQRGMALAAVLLLGLGGFLCLGDGAGSPLYLVLTGANNQQLSWPSIAGGRYTVQTSTDLTTWYDVDVVTATGATTIWNDPFPRTDAKGFYRIVVPQAQVRRIEPSVVQSGAATTVYFVGECFASGGSILVDGVPQAPGTLVFDSATQMHAALTLAAGEHTVVIKDASGATLAGGSIFVLASASGLTIEVPPVGSLALGSGNEGGAGTIRPFPPLLGPNGFAKVTGMDLPAWDSLRPAPAFNNLLVDATVIAPAPVRPDNDAETLPGLPPRVTTGTRPQGPIQMPLPPPLRPNGFGTVTQADLPPITPLPFVGGVDGYPMSGSFSRSVSADAADVCSFLINCPDVEPGCPNGHPGCRRFPNCKRGEWTPEMEAARRRQNRFRDLEEAIRKSKALDELEQAESSRSSAMPWRGDVPMDSIMCSFGGSGLDVTPAGEVRIGGIDLALPGVGLDLVWARSYRSRLGADSAMGMGWDFSYNIRAQKDSPTQVTVFDGNGRADVFRQQPSGAFECAERFETGVLSGGGTVFTLTFADGGKWEFGAFGALPGPANLARVVTIRDRNNNAITCAYDGGTGRLLTVSDAAGRSLAIAYDGAGWIQSVTDSTGRTVVYTHDAAGDLIAVRSPIVVGTPHGNDFPAGKTISFTYSSGTGDPERDHNLLTIIDALAQTPVVITYLPEPLAANIGYDRAERIQLGSAGQDIVLSYERLTPSPGNRFAVLRIYLNDRNGHLTEIDCDSMNRIVRCRRYTGACTAGVAVTAVSNRPGPSLRPGDPPLYETLADWNADSLCTKLTEPRRNTLEWLHEADLRAAGTVPARQRARLIVFRQRAEVAGVYDQDEIMMRFVHDERFGADRGVSFPTQIIDERGYATQCFYDTKANLLSEKCARVVASPAAPTTNTMAVADCGYNAQGQIISVLGPHNGNQRRLDTFLYVPAGPQKGWLASVKCDDGGFNITTQFEYNDTGAVTRIVDPRGNDTLITRNALNQAVRVEGPLVALATPRRQRATIYYNANNRVTQVDTLNFDEAGVIAANAEFTTTIAHDVLNLPVLVTEEIDAVTTRSTQLVYDAERNCTQVLLPMAVAALQPANRVLIAFDERNLPYTVTSAPGAPEQSTARYDYDTNANCTAVTQGTEGAQPRVWTMEYSPFRYSAEAGMPWPLPGPFEPLRYCIDGSFRNCWWKPFEPLRNCVYFQTVIEVDFGLHLPGGSDTPSDYAAPYAFTTAPNISNPDAGRDWDQAMKTTDPSGNETRLYRDPAGNVVLATFKGELNDVPGSGGNVTLYQSTAGYDFANRQTTESVSHFALTGGAPIGDGSRTTTCVWNDNGTVASVTDDRGFTTDLDRDTAGRLSLITDAKGNTLAATRDANSNSTVLTSTELSDLGGPAQVFVVNCAYDEANRLKSVTDTVSSQTTLAYDSRSNLKKLVNPRLNAVLCIFDGLSRRLKTIRDADGSLSETPADAVSQSAFDLDSRLIAFTDDNGNVTQYTHDPLNRAKLVTHADGTTESAVYDVHHNVTQSIDANGTVVNAFFDLSDRVVAKNIIPGAGVAGTTVSETFSYDGASHLIGGTSNGTVAHSFARTHDSFGNPLTESQDGVPTVASTYDALGNLLTIAYPGGRVVTTTFDTLNRASVIADTSGAVASIKYIGPDRIERIDYGNGTRCDLTWNGIDGVPNAPGDFGWRRIARVTHTHVASATVIDDRSFAWDRNQNKTQRKDLRLGGPQLTHDYTYNGLDQLTVTSVSQPGPVLVRQTNYALDGESNRINVAGLGTPDPGPYTRSAVNPPADAQMNQYTTTPLGAHSYDANGNQTARAGAVYVFDYRKRLVAVTGIPVPESYEYDALGRRVKKIAGPTTTTYGFTGALNITQNQTALGTSDYVFNIVTRGPVTDAWLHTDDLGNTMTLSDTAGAAIERVEYADYGAPQFFTAGGAPLPASAANNPWLFGGMRYENETGLYCATSGPVQITGPFDGDASNTKCSARMLDPKTGQWLQRSEGGTQNSGTNGWNRATRHFRGANPWSR